MNYPERSDPLLFLDPRPGESRAQAFAGLKQAIQDTLRSLVDLSFKQWAEIDDALKNAGAPSLYQVQRAISGQIPKIMNRGRISNDSEFYLVKEMIVAHTSEDLTDKEEMFFQRMLEEYEFGGKQAK